jgi:uncharacterized membrane protein YdjX (TVP38/TMEM64 family)
MIPRNSGEPRSYSTTMAKYTDGMKRTLIKRLLIATLIICVIAFYNIFSLGHYLTLSQIKAYQKALKGLYTAHPIFFVAAYMLIYILYSAFPLPGVEVISVAAGALFGTLAGTLIVSFASSIGATLACLISRFLFRDWVQSTFGDKVSAVNRGIEQNGAFYLFSLRLIPIIPYFAVNLLMGLSPMPLKTFYLVSQVGMIPATFLFVNAGKELARIQSSSDILSTRLLLSLVLIGLFPLVTSKIVSLYKRHKK